MCRVPPGLAATGRCPWLRTAAGDPLPRKCTYLVGSEAFYMRLVRHSAWQELRVCLSPVTKAHLWLYLGSKGPGASSCLVLVPRISSILQVSLLVLTLEVRTVGGHGDALAGGLHRH